MRYFYYTEVFYSNKSIIIVMRNKNELEFNHDF